MGKTNKNALTLMKKKIKPCYFLGGNSNRNDNDDKKKCYHFLSTYYQLGRRFNTLQALIHLSMPTIM